MSHQVEYYKVLTQDLLSVCVWSDEQIVVQYRINEWVYPKLPSSCLMVFNHINHAIDFADAFSYRTQIYKCEIIPTKKQKPIFINPFYFYPSEIYNELKKALKLKQQHKKFESRHDLTPFGTIFCDAVKITNFCKAVKVTSSVMQSK